jgi:hypothetical protein
MINAKLQVKDEIIDDYIFIYLERNAAVSLAAQLRPWAVKSLKQTK